MTPSDQALLTPCARILDKIHVTNMEPATKRTNDGGLELPEELLLEICEYVARVAAVVRYMCSTHHDDERIICYRAPPGVSLTFGPEAFPRGVRVVLDVDTAPLPLAVAVWDLQTITDLDATAVPLGYV